MTYLASCRRLAPLAIMALGASPALADDYLPPDPSYSACWDASCVRSPTPEAAAQDYIETCNQDAGYQACTLYRGPYQPDGGSEFWGQWYFQVNGANDVAINFYDGCPEGSSFMYDGDYAGMCFRAGEDIPSIVTTPDEGPYRLHGTLSGQPQLMASPWAGFGNAFKFDGLTDQIDLGASPAHQFTGLPIGTTRTIDVRFRSSSGWAENWGRTIMSRATVLNEEKNTVAPGDDWLLFVKGAFGLQDITFVYADGSGGASAISAFVGVNGAYGVQASSQANVPHVLRITLLPGGIPTLQVDGGPIFKGQLPVATSGVNNLATYVGGYAMAPYRGQRLPGYIDEVRFSNGLRTDAIDAPYLADDAVTALYHFDVLGSLAPGE